MELPKIHSITKKILVALVGAFLLIFLLFHATANLFVLRHDGGAWYSAFCHFMGTNWIVKVFEIILLGVLALHVLLTLWLQVTNRLAGVSSADNRFFKRRYHEAQKSKTDSTSKLMMWTGILIFAFLVTHFCQFYFVKLGWVKGEYMVKVEKLQDPEMMQLVQYSAQMQMSPEEILAEMEQQAAEYGQSDESTRYIASLRDKMGVMDIVQRAQQEGNFSEDMQWIRHLTYDERQTLRRVMPESDPEPEFYYMVRELFHNPLMVLLYLITFVALFMHMRHAFPSAFQTLGLNNYKYSRAIEICGIVYAWLICLMFAAVPVLVYLGL